MQTFKSSINIQFRPLRLPQGAEVKLRPIQKRIEQAIKSLKFEPADFRIKSTITVPISVTARVLLKGKLKLEAKTRKFPGGGPAPHPPHKIEVAP